jgi:hypothetical protein
MQVVCTWWQVLMHVANAMLWILGALQTTIIQAAVLADLLPQLLTVLDACCALAIKLAHAKQP